MIEAPGFIVALGCLTAAFLGGLLMAYLYYLVAVHVWPWLATSTFEVSLKTRWGQKRAIRRFDELQTYSPYRLEFWQNWLTKGYPSKRPAYAPLAVSHIRHRIAEWEAEHPRKKQRLPDPDWRLYQEKPTP